MTKNEIKRTVEMVTEVAGQEAAEKYLLIVVKSKSLGRERRKMIKDFFDREYTGDKARVRELMKGMKPGFVMRAYDANTYHLWEGDMAATWVEDGEITAYSNTGEVKVIRPENFTLSGARWIDPENAELIDMHMAARIAIKKGLDAGRSKLYEGY